MMPLAEKFGLPKNTQIEVLGANHLAIVKMIKSRIISKDAEKIVEMAGLIRQKEPNTEVSLICSGNICSKSIQLLENNQIGILIDEEG
jgi:hypothetical protein